MAGGGLAVIGCMYRACVGVKRLGDSKRHSAAVEKREGLAASGGSGCGC